MNESTQPVKLFYSYSHLDERLRLQLESHLDVLKRMGVIAGWHDRRIGAGQDWKNEIDEHLNSARIVLLLVSSNFLGSDYCYDKEMTRALERHERGEARVIPVILRPCLWKQAPFAKLQAVPRNGRPVTKWADRHEAFLDVAEAIRSAALELGAASSLKKPASEYAAPITGEVTTAKETVEVTTIEEPSAKLRVVDPKDLPNFAVFRDVEAPWCPELMVLPAGEFLMGSPPGEEGRSDSEGPQHRVRIGDRFAIGRYPVTSEEYNHFCAAARRKKPDDAGWGRGRRPVINVNWEGAEAYAGWLAKKTGKPYRLPTEAEWEYACRAGATTRYWCGNTITKQDAKFAEWLKFGEMIFGKTAEVGSYLPNPWGLYDTHGNVWEWVEDVWHENYQGAPSDGRAWLEGGDQVRRVLRGGSCNCPPWFARSAYRHRSDIDNRRDIIGFRVARTL